MMTKERWLFTLKSGTLRFWDFSVAAILLFEILNRDSESNFPKNAAPIYPFNPTMLEARGDGCWENGSGLDTVFKQQHLQGCFEGIFFNGGKEAAQGKQHTVVG